MPLDNISDKDALLLTALTAGAAVAGKKGYDAYKKRKFLSKFNPNKKSLTKEVEEKIGPLDAHAENIQNMLDIINSRK